MNSYTPIPYPAKYHTTGAPHLLSAFRQLFDPTRKSSKTIIMVLSDEEVPKARKIIHDVTGSLNHPNTGIFFAMPALFVNPTHLVLPTVGLMGLCYVIVRVIGKWLGAFLGSRIVHAHPNVQKYLGVTLIPQASVEIGMAK